VIDHFEHVRFLPFDGHVHKSRTPYHGLSPSAIARLDLTNWTAVGIRRPKNQQVMNSNLRARQ
jgi:hypothetical protein